MSVRDRIRIRYSRRERRELVRAVRIALSEIIEIELIDRAYIGDFSAQAFGELFGDNVFGLYEGITELIYDVAERAHEAVGYSASGEGRDILSVFGYKSREDKYAVLAADVSREGNDSRREPSESRNLYVEAGSQSFKEFLFGCESIPVGDYEHTDFAQVGFIGGFDFRNKSVVCSVERRVRNKSKLHIDLRFHYTTFSLFNQAARARKKSVLPDLRLRESPPVR